MKKYNRKRDQMNRQARTYARTLARTIISKVKKGLTETRTRINEKKILMPY